MGPFTARLRPAAAALATILLANLAAIVALWLRAGGTSDLHDAASLLTTVGRLAGLLGAASALAQVVLLARLPVLDRLYGFDRLAVPRRQIVMERSAL